MSAVSKDHERVMWATMETPDREDHGPQMTRLTAGIKGVDRPGDWRAYVLIRSDDYHFTIYDRFDHPLGTIHRPRRDGADGQDGYWEVADSNGLFSYRSAGPATCFWALVEWRYRLVAMALLGEKVEA